ncbi:PREDICTED: lachrymatory-factor synthase [Tarenaya hassleriana]|uniref:lachrymatory-factor synthase n=1 Tax=Tarenaya hassleriana TaxID=28532 RepID=UPI00053C972B|nr:PREDICTED: lachrymatory-factor synthase [Tarenaya hassleriana]
MENETAPSKWEGKHVAGVNGVTAEKIWTAVSDFCNVDKWFPRLDTCRRVEGSDGQVGLIRYCASTETKSDGSGAAAVTKWAKERLVKFDPIGRCISYEILENNVGFGSYAATVKVNPTDGGDEGVGCEIEWSFVADPVEGWKKEDLDSYVEFSLKHMTKKMEDYFLSA